MGDFACLSGYIEFPHPTKKEIDRFGDVVYERSVMESLAFAIYEPDAEIFDKIRCLVNDGDLFSIKYDLIS